MGKRWRQDPDLHPADGGQFTGVMRDAGDRTVMVMDELKKRRDVLIGDPDLVAAIKAFQPEYLDELEEENTAGGTLDGWNNP